MRLQPPSRMYALVLSWLVKEHRAGALVGERRSLATAPCTIKDSVAVAGLSVVTARRAVRAITAIAGLVAVTALAVGRGSPGETRAQAPLYVCRPLQSIPSSVQGVVLLSPIDAQTPQQPRTRPSLTLQPPAIPNCAPGGADPLRCAAIVEPTGDRYHTAAVELQQAATIYE